MRFLPMLAFTLHAATAAAQMYSWKDADGKIQYSDQPPPGKVPVRTVAPPPAPSLDPAARQQALSRDMEARQKQKDARKAAGKTEQERAAAEERRAACEKAKGNLQSIESGITRFTVNAAGERVALDGAVREAELANARKAVDSWCK